MMLNQIKKSLYSFLPKKIRKKIKNFYYDSIIPFYNLRNKIRYGFGDFFDHIALETTTYCNLRCNLCPNSKYERGLLKNQKLMDDKLFKKIINELSEFNYRGQLLFHFYGEPLTDKRLPEFVSYARKRLPKADLQINTNGFLLTIPLYEKLVASGVDSFFITQYFKEIPPNIKKLLIYLRNKPKKHNKIKYRVLGSELSLSNRGGEIKVDNPVDSERPICAYPKNILNIDYFGNVILCCNDYHSSIIFGNLKREKLLNIWNKSDYRKFRKELKKRIFKLSICRRCVGIE